MIKKIENKTLMDAIKNIYNSDPENFLLIQIGANDGWMCDRMFDFVKEFDPKAIMVEPIPDYFLALKNNYRDNNNIIFENLAIDDKEGVRQMTFIPQSRFDNYEVDFRMESTRHLIPEHWGRGLGSFYNNKNNLACPELAKFTETINVKTLSYRQLLEKHNVKDYKNIVIQTDCEGHDFILLKQFDFNYVKPIIYISEIYGRTRIPMSHPKYVPHPVRGFVEYEVDNVLYTIEEEEEAIKMLKDEDYELFRNGDLIAISKEIIL